MHFLRILNSNLSSWTIKRKGLGALKSTEYLPAFVQATQSLQIISSPPFRQTKLFMSDINISFSFCKLKYSLVKEKRRENVDYKREFYKEKSEFQLKIQRFMSEHKGKFKILQCFHKKIYMWMNYILYKWPKHRIYTLHYDLLDFFPIM